MGVVLFEMLTGGKLPFDGEHAKISGSTDERISWEQVNLAPPALRRLNPAVPANVEAAVMRCLEKQPEQRFEKPMELLDALEGSYQAAVPDHLPRRACQQPAQAAGCRDACSTSDERDAASAGETSATAGQLKAVHPTDACPTDRQFEAACSADARSTYS